ncbi:MATE family efflux transporter [Ruminococcus sp. 5_1_39BFAA]|uniref:MATE family efflux transporter n=1 Tax=Ruminococcus sp. 5_1_39BFAA TaxID=457412 RepID=UPI0035684E8D
MDQTNQLGKEKIGKLLLIFSVPSVVSLVLNALYNMVDQIFIGQGVGYLGNGATNVIFPLTQLAVAFGLLLGDGTASYINLKLGQGSKKDASKGMAAGVTGLLAVGILLFVILFGEEKMSIWK